MAADTKIEWCDHTFNPWIGCTKVSTAATCGGGCDGCYAEVSTPVRVLRAKGIETWGPHAARHRTSPSNWAKPRHWNAQHEAFFAEHGRRQRVFCASLADVFDNAAPIDVFTEFLDLCRLTPNLDKLLLTKRIGNVKRRLEEALEYAGGVMMNPLLTKWLVHWLDGDAPSDVWLGATVVNQLEADRDIPKLLTTPARIRFLSMEPLLGPVDLHLPWFRMPGTRYRPRLHWVIVGGESGPRARPMPSAWVRSLRDQCAIADVPFLFKQWGEWIDPSQHGAAREANGFAPIREFAMVDGHGRQHRVGKKAAGRILDDRTWDQFPEAHHGAA